MILKVENLITKFHMKAGVVNAVNGVDFELNEGEVVALVGESGSGKSVTSLSVMGLIPTPPGEIAGGKIIFDGEDLLSKTKREMQDLRGNKLSMIFQEPMTSLNPVFTIGKQISESLIRHKKLKKKEAMKKTIKMLEAVGIPSPEERVKQYPHELSGGMRQRIMIAIALVCEPKLLIADEPTTALDVTIQAQILDLMIRLKEEFNTSILLITHDLGVVAEVADRVVVMYCGRVVETATVEELFEKPLHPYTFGLIESIPKIDEEVDRLFMIDGNVPNPLNMPAGCPFKSRCSRKIKKCDLEVPNMKNINGRNVRCHLYEDELEVK
ncbi:MAG: ABC transporter ATP-binding protein [Tissierellales bacterium]|jgi:oligopeptide/dipeptide ABC transporter ATP-binding protein|nr:ABC transporter ATP-binding protein [Tissierellales bacterium]